jgi:hypothetical protein
MSTVLLVDAITSLLYIRAPGVKLDLIAVLNNAICGECRVVDECEEGRGFCDCGESSQDRV